MTEAVAAARDSERAWAALLSRYLPIADVNSMWRSAPGRRPLPRQGWKLHVSALLPDAVSMLGRVAPLLDEAGLAWKATKDLHVVEVLNSGIVYGYSQIGKVVTVYAVDRDCARYVADQLDEVLEGLHGPRVPFDRRWRPGSLVHYRYGVLAADDKMAEGIPNALELMAPDGRVVADQRAPGAAVPSWVDDLRVDAWDSRDPIRNQWRRRYLAYEALMQRGKGGTYLALDVASDPPRRCVVREGRRHGETGWDRRDGAARVRHGLDVLELMTMAHVAVPRVLDHFVADDHQHLILEHLDGRNLARWIAAGAQNPTRVLRTARDAAAVVASLHALGWAWRDCKIANFVMTEAGSYAIDLE